MEATETQNLIAQDPSHNITAAVDTTTKRLLAALEATVSGNLGIDQTLE
jgi:hypothetical protein